MAKQVINVGTTSNDRTGDSIRSAFTKVNSNFTELYNAIFNEPSVRDIVGSIFADDSTLLVDAVAGKIVGPVFSNVTGNVTGNVIGNVTGNLTGNVTGNVTGNLVGDIRGSVFADDSSVMVNAIDRKLVSTTAEFGNIEIAGSVIATTDSSSITIDQAVNLNSNVNVGGDLLPQTANGGNLGSASNPWHSLYVSNSTIYIGGNALGLDNEGELVWNGSRIAHAGGEYITLDSLTDVNANSPNAGDTIVWSGGAWVNVTLPTLTSQLTNDSGFLTNSVLNNGLDADLKGSVFGDDSTILVDGVAGRIVGPVYTSTLRTDAAAIALGEGAAETNQGTQAIAIGRLAGQTDQGLRGIAIGHQAAYVSQGQRGIAIGTAAGAANQGAFAIAMGQDCANANQGTEAIALGTSAGQTNQGTYAIAIGYSAASSGQGANAIAIGRSAVNSNQTAGSIVLNATGTAVTAAAAGFYISPVRNTTGTSLLAYNSSTKEITHSNIIASEGDISIEINLSDSTLRRWSFGEDGDFTIPGNLIYGGDTIHAKESTSTAGNPLTVRAGDSETQVGGNLILRGGDTIGSVGTPRNSGWAVLRAGSTVTGNGGYAELLGGNTTAGTGGQAYVTAGSTTTGNGGPVEITAGDTVTGDGGSVTIESGEAVTGTAGNINITAKGTVTGDGGNVNLNGGSATSGNGGAINLTAGDTIGSGDPGTIRLRTFNAAAPQDWTFNFNGTLTFPDATVQNTAFTTDPTLNVLKIDDGVHEKFQTKSNATGVVTHDCSLGHVFYHTLPSANWTVNLTNLNLAVGYATAVTLVIEQGATGRYPSAVQVAGNAVPLAWQGNTTPTPSSNRFDVVTFSILYDGLYTVLGQLTGF